MSPAPGRPPADNDWVTSVPPLDRLGPAQHQALTAAAERVAIGVDETLLNEGQPSTEVFALVEGVVGVFYNTPEGGGLMVKVFTAPAMFGEMELFFDLPRMESVVALSDVVAMRIDGATFLKLAREDNALCFELLRDLAGRLCIAADNERSLAFEPVEARLAALFLSFVEASRVGPYARRELPFRLTYHTLARCLGVTERSIERTVSKWLAAGWVSRSAGRYTFADMSELEALAPAQRLHLASRLGSAPRGR